MHNHTGKTKTAMLLELESIKGLLVEEDGIPILQEVIAEEIPILDMIVQPEDLPEESIPLLVSVVMDEGLGNERFVANESLIADENLAVDEQQPSALQAQFAAQEDILDWPDADLGTELSLKIELTAEPETEIPYSEYNLPETEPAITLTTPSDAGSWDETDLPPSEIPILVVTETYMELATVEPAETVETFSSVENTAEQEIIEKPYAKPDQDIEENTEEKIGLDTEEKLEGTSEHTNETTALEAQSKEAQSKEAQFEAPPRRAEQQQDFFQTGEEAQAEPSNEPLATPALSSPVALSSRPAAAKSAGENPFLPEHIRARLQGNNSTHSNNPGEYTGDIHNKRFKALALGSLHSNSQAANQPAPIQQQLINEIMDKMLPEMAKELRGRLEKMSKKMLAELLAEHKP